jgi:Protein of unknown function (DUF559)
MHRADAPEPAFTGPFAARLLGLDGFRDIEWPIAVCQPVEREAEPNIIRVRKWHPSSEVEGVPVAHPALVLRHLGLDERALKHAASVDGIKPLDRIEFATEHVLRNKSATIEQMRVRGSHDNGDRLLHLVLDRREDTPPTESYAETDAAQLFRSFELRPWRQMHVVSEAGRYLYRCDFVIPFRRRPKPTLLMPHHGLIVEIYGREYHDETFEEDHARQTTYDRMGFHWLTFTANQIARDRKNVRLAIDAVMAKAERLSRRAA